MDDIFEQKVLTEHEDDAKKPVKSNFVENIKIETIEEYERALALNDKATLKRIEWELATLTIHKKDLMEYVETRKAAGLTAEPTRDDIARVNGELPMKESWKIVETMNLPSDEEMMQGGKNQNGKRSQREDRRRRN
ncbi:MAG: hypothetical protein K6A72_05655 [Lachnospiraceae bacterium]|nr:hypothetical protein [Lachnospiraceae bacterium]